METVSLSPYAALAPDGSAFVILDGQENKSILRAYDRTGAKLWESQWLEGAPLHPVLLNVAQDCRSTVFSAGASTLGEAPDWSVHSIGEEGQRLWSFEPGEVTWAARFSHSGETLVLVSTHWLRMMDASTGEVLWKFKPKAPWPGRMQNVAVTMDGDLLAVSAYGDRRCTPANGELFIFSGNGALLYRSRAHICTPLLSPSGQFLAKNIDGGLSLHRLDWVE